MTEVGPVIASGRSADIHDFGPTRVLRRLRSGTISPAEPLVMRAVRSEGFPAPEIYSVDGGDMVMDRVDGIDLLAHLKSRPWQARRVGSMLADLHRQLAEISTADVDLAPSFGPPDAFVHGDLHPGNVLLTVHGPVVIDWEGAGIGPSDADTATTWLLLVTAEADDVPWTIRPLVGLIRRTVLRAFLRGVSPPSATTISAVCAERLDDPNMRPVEISRIRAFAARHGTQ